MQSLDAWIAGQCLGRNLTGMSPKGLEIIFREAEHRKAIICVFSYSLAQSMAVPSVARMDMNIVKTFKIIYCFIVPLVGIAVMQCYLPKSILDNGLRYKFVDGRSPCFGYV